MKRGLTGRYEVSHAGGEAVLMFVPYPLPSSPPVTLFGSLPRHSRL